MLLYLRVVVGETPAITRVRFINVNNDKVSLTLELVSKLNKGSYLCHEWRSGAASKVYHQGDARSRIT